MDRIALHADLLSYSEARRRLLTMGIVMSDVPIESAVSLPLPTNRWSIPGYAVFAGPALRIPGEAPIQAAPDRWWVYGARGGHLLIYALQAVQSFVPGELFSDVTLNNSSRTIDEMREDLAVLDRLMDGLVPAFFAGAAGELDRRRAVSETLSLVIPSQLTPRYRALVPDFFAWLEA